MAVVRFFVIILCVLFLQACTQGHCRRNQTQDKVHAQPIPNAATPSAGGAGAQDATVFVSKADASRQCQKGTGIGLERMAKELAPIPIISSKKASDGLMRMQVCGSPAGIFNVYEINAKQLKQAQKSGFKKWEK